MRQVQTLEFAGKSKLNFDLYDERGTLVYQQGSVLSPELLMRFNYLKVFRKEEADFQKEGRRLSGNSEVKPIISAQATTILSKNARTLLKKVYNNERPDISDYQDTTKIILNEVVDNLDKMDCIAQLRIYDEYTFSHTVNVSAMSSALGIILKLSENEIEELALGALLHDIGKMHIPLDILNKPAKLDAEEFEIMKSHTLFGYKYINKYMETTDEVAKVALDHQERYSGGGYPNGLVGKEISLYAQITSIADVYDALISNRVYKRAFDANVAIDIMVSESEKSFNPYIFNKFLKMSRSIGG